MNRLSIISYCIIEENTIYKNGEILYKYNSNSPKCFIDEAYSQLGFSYPKFYKMDNLSKLGWLASEILLKDEQLNERYNSENIGIVLSNSNASLDADIHYAKTINEVPSPALFVYTLPNIVIGEIAIRNGFKGENAFFVSDNFDALLLQQYAEMLFASNAVMACICGWVEVLKNEYKCVLYLVEKEDRNLNIEFTEAHLEKIFNANAER